MKSAVVIFALLVVVGCMTPQPVETSTTDQEMRSQCWEGEGWWQCCDWDEETGSGGCCVLRAGGDLNCFGI